MAAFQTRDASEVRWINLEKEITQLNDTIIQTETQLSIRSSKLYPNNTNQPEKLSCKLMELVKKIEKKNH